jgi:PST family polysaccharide transporter
LGEQWHGAVPLLQILAIGGAFKALSQINYWAYLIEQQSQQLMLSGLVTKPLQILLVVVAAFFGIDWVAWAFVAGRAIAWPVNLIWLQRCSGQSAREFGTNGMRFALSAAIAYGISRWVIGEIAMDSPWLNVLIGAALSAAIYLGTILATPGGRREIEGVGRVARSMMHR